MIKTRRTALVTGAAQGIGEAIAHRLAADGMAVAVVDLDQASAERVAAAIRGGGGEAIGLGADVTVREDVERAVAATVEALGGLHVLVNNAGITRDNLLFKMTDADWGAVMDVHLRGAFLMTQTAMPHMREAQFGRIVSLSSASALGNRGQANYSAAKAGVQGFTKTVAAELGPYGITSNCIAPGFIETPMTDATAERMRMTADELRSVVAAALPVRRVGVPADIAHAISFLVSEDAGYVTGQVVYVDGGALTVR